MCQQDEVCLILTPVTMTKDLIKLKEGWLAFGMINIQVLHVPFSNIKLNNFLSLPISFALPPANLKASLCNDPSKRV